MHRPLWSPAFRYAATDRRLQPMERSAVIVLWEHLSTDEWRPMKAEALGALLGVKRPNAARILRRLVHLRYLVMQEQINGPRLFLLVNVVMPTENAA